MIPPLSFVAFEYAHLEPFKKWLKKPHVKEFWTEPETHEELEKKFLHDLPRRGVHAFILLNQGSPVGYFQYYDAHTIGGGWWPHEKERTIGIDLLIGDETLLGSGIPVQAARLLIDHILKSEKPTSIIADPDIKNSRAIRFFEKLGFKNEGPTQTPNGTAALLRLTSGA